MRISSVVLPDGRVVVVEATLVVVTLVVVVVVELGEAPVTRYSTCRSGAPVGLPSNALATRLPVPVTISAIGRPDVQPGRFTSSWMSGTRLAVR
jgi:hypothetical protein